MKNLLLLTITILSSFTNECISQNIWEPTNGPNDLGIADLVFTSEDYLVISVNVSGIYISKDNTISWKKIDKGLMKPNSYANSLALGNDGSIYANIDDNLFRLDNNSDEWIQLRDNLFATNKLMTNEIGRLYIVNIDRLPIEYSDDRGSSFQKMFVNQSYDYITNIVLRGNGNNYMSVHENLRYVLYRFNDDGTGLTKLMESNFLIYDLVWHPAGYLFVHSTKEGFIRMDKDGNNRKVINFDNLNVKRLTLKPNGTLIAFADVGDYESTDLGENWTLASTSLFKSFVPNTNPSILERNQLFFNKNDFYIYYTEVYCSSSPLHKTSDGGLSWTSFEDLFRSRMVNELFFDKQDRLFAKICFYGRYTSSNDHGKSWQIINSPIEPRHSANLVSSISNNLFFRSDDKLFKSVDFGLNWIEYTLPEKTSLFGLISDHAKFIYALGNPVSFMSKDGGENWNKIETPSLPVNKGFFHPDGTVFALNESHPNNTFSPDLFFTNDFGIHWTKLSLKFRELKAFTISKKGLIYFSTISGPANVYLSHDKLLSYSIIKPGNQFALITDNDESVYTLLGSQCEKSIDEGKTWQHFESGLPDYGYGTSFALDKSNYLYSSFHEDFAFKTILPISNPVDTKEEKKNLVVSIHPNPIETNMTINIPDKNISSGHFKIIDLNGTEKLKGDFQSNVFTIDCSTLTNGMAFIQIFGKGNSHYTEKIVIVH